MENWNSHPGPAVTWHPFPRVLIEAKLGDLDFHLYLVVVQQHPYICCWSNLRRSQLKSKA